MYLLLPYDCATQCMRSYNYLCNSKYYGHVYNFFRWANPLQGGQALELETSVGEIERAVRQVRFGAHRC